MFLFYYGLFILLITQWELQLKALQPKTYKILPHTLANTQDLLTSRVGLLVPLQLMDSIQLAECIRAYKSSQIIQTMILMQHEGGNNLRDLHVLKDDKALLSILPMKTLPIDITLCDWLRQVGARIGALPGIHQALQHLNRHLLRSELYCTDASRWILMPVRS